MKRKMIRSNRCKEFHRRRGAQMECKKRRRRTPTQAHTQKTTPSLWTAKVVKRNGERTKDLIFTLKRKNIIFIKVLSFLVLFLSKKSKPRKFLSDGELLEDNRAYQLSNFITIFFY